MQYSNLTKKSGEAGVTIGLGGLAPQSHPEIKINGEGVGGIGHLFVCCDLSFCVFGIECHSFTDFLPHKRCLICFVADSIDFPESLTVK